ncbi:MAG: Crp/Fnr family transcriptional regulator [Oscillospiraceae bacterium]|nr:Crp/Fnr family transcriptional regulator [Oscillospiraceae bacterium]
MFLWSGLQDAQIDEISKLLSKPKVCEKGSELSCSRMLGIVLSGTAKIMKSLGSGTDVVMRTLSASEVFGVASMFSETKSESLSKITAENDCTVLYISEELIYKLMQKYPTVSINYIKFLTGRIRFLNHRIDSFTAGSAEQKLLEYLVQNSHEDGEVVLNHSMSELAKRLNIGRSSLYRSLETLEKSGAIVRQKNCFFITPTE